MTRYCGLLPTLECDRSGGPQQGELVAQCDGSTPAEDAKSCHPQHQVRSFLKT